MTRITVTTIAPLRIVKLGLLASLLAASGCSEPTPTSTTDDPELKASMAKRVEVYKAKSHPAKKGAAGPKS